MILKVADIYYNLNKIHNMYYIEGYLHITMKFKENKMKDIRESVSIKIEDNEAREIMNKFEQLGTTISIHDIHDNVDYIVNLSEIVKMNYGKDRTGTGRLFMLEANGSNVGYAVTKETANSIIERYKQIK